MEKQTLKVLGKRLQQSFSLAESLPVEMQEALRALANAEGEQEEMPEGEPRQCRELADS